MTNKRQKIIRLSEKSFQTTKRHGEIDEIKTELLFWLIDFATIESQRNECRESNLYNWYENLCYHICSWKGENNTKLINLFLQSIFISNKFRRVLLKCIRELLFKFYQIFVSNLSNIKYEWIRIIYIFKNVIIFCKISVRYFLCQVKNLQVFMVDHKFYFIFATTFFNIELNEL